MSNLDMISISNINGETRVHSTFRDNNIITRTAKAGGIKAIEKAIENQTVRIEVHIVPERKITNTYSIPSFLLVFLTHKEG